MTRGGQETSVQSNTGKLLSRRLPPLNPRLGVSVMKQPKKKTHKKRDSLDALYNKRDRALERVVAIWTRDPDEESVDLNRALDVLTLAHAAATFEFVGG
jgi:hypothetical protein